MKKTLAGLAVALAVAGVLAWLHWQAGRIMVRARNTDRHFFNEIIVREVPIRRSPIWMLLRCDQYNYRCEYYTPMGHERPWSTHTYSSDSFSASTAGIAWRNETEATVYLDGYPVLKCIDGWWTRANSAAAPSAGP